MNLALPESLDVGGTEWAIRSDYRVAIDVCVALGSPEYSSREKSYITLIAMYPDIDDIPPALYGDALKQAFWFIDGGKAPENTKAPKLVDWEQDMQHIIAPINRIVGGEIRAFKHMHWWTFLSAYAEIGGDCVFAQVVQIRDKLSRGKKLDKAEQEWYRRNRRLVDFRGEYASSDDALLGQWGVNSPLK